MGKLRFLFALRPVLSLLLLFALWPVLSLLLLFALRFVAAPAVLAFLALRAVEACQAFLFHQVGGRLLALGGFLFGQQGVYAHALFVECDYFERAA